MIAVDLGKVSYDEGLYYQEVLHAARVEGRIEDVVLLLEHDPIITVGKSGGNGDLLVREDELAERGIIIRHVNRGGKLTCHYPGQLVVYPIMNLNDQGQDVHGFVNNLEEIIICTLADFGVAGERIRKHRGVFVKDNKIASIGIEVRSSTTMHGFSLNVSEDWSLYTLFVPCGIKDKGITFLESCCSDDKVDMKTVKKGVKHHFENIFSSVISEIEFQPECKPTQNLDRLISAGHFNKSMSTVHYRNLH